ncbi:MAG: filamentous hemagglutinin N-terminal domain-containing protein, partial [Rhodospirillales bacterium]|nr:filamentous hemagglutinin N-terminal domain-containing protein [Rhodospirillales bacterium]
MLLYTLNVSIVPAFGLPSNGTVVEGRADINIVSPGEISIKQYTDKVIIDWQDFSINAGEIVSFVQPGFSSFALNRVLGGSLSSINGTLNANGHLGIVNPNGINFGPNSRVNVGGIVASTIDITNQRFLAGDFKFDILDNPQSQIINRGTITAGTGGLVALVAPGVENSGIIQAKLGEVVLASGKAFTLDFWGDDLFTFPVGSEVTEQLFDEDGEPVESLVKSGGKISADGGSVLLTANAASGVVDTVVNMDGVIEARSVAEINGQIVLGGGDYGIVEVAGTLDVSGADTGEKGGTVKVLGEKVGLIGEAKIDASGDKGGGEVLIGGNFQGKGPEQNATATFIGIDTQIDASAKTVGDAGRVIIWADDVTRYYGEILALGGEISGDGGFAEVSGKGHLDFDGDTNLSAQNGEFGTLLLDPLNITITNNPQNNMNVIGGSGIYTPTGANSNLKASKILNNLDSGNLLITTAAGGGENGDIFLNVDLIGRATSRNLTMSAHRNINISNNLNFNTSGSPGTITLTAVGNITVSANKVVRTRNRNITLTANNMNISGTVNSGTATTTLATTAGNTINLGTNAGAANALELTDAELDRVTAGNIIVGSTTAGAVTVSADISPANATLLRIRSGSTITGTAGGITETSLGLVAGGAINFTDTTTNVTTLAASTTTGDITFTEADGFTVGTVSDVVGVDTNNGAVNLTATTGNLVVSNTANANDVEATGGITLSALADEAVVTVDATADVESSAGNLMLIADDIVLAGTLTASAGVNQSVTLAPETAIDADTINLGTDAATANVFEITNADIDQITTDTVVVGAAAAGAMTVSADITPANATTLHLKSGGGITGTAGGIIETNLALTAGGTINFTDTTTDVDNLAISAAGQTATFMDLDDLDIDTVDAVVGATAATLNLSTGAALTDAQAITATNLSISNTAATTTLDVAANDVDNLAISAAGQTVTFVDVDDLDIDTVNGIVGATATTLNLTTGGALSDTQRTVATNLSITNTAATTTLDVAANDVDNLAVNAAGQALTFVDVDDLDIDTVNGIVGATAATLNLTASGILSDTQKIAATNFSITNTAATTTLDVAANDVDNLAVNAAGQTVTFVDVDDLDIDTVNGIVGATAATLNLTTGGILSDTQRTVATNLSITNTTAATTLDVAANDVTNLAVSAAGQTVTIVDVDDLNIDTVNGIVGATAATLNLTTGGTLSDTQRTVAT